jgi:hypothetical protein
MNERNKEKEFKEFEKMSDKVLGIGIPSSLKFLKFQIMELISSQPSLQEALQIIRRMEWYYAQAKKYKWKKEKVIAKNWKTIMEKHYIHNFLSTEATNQLRNVTFNNCLIDDQTFNVIMKLAEEDYTRQKELLKAKKSIQL